MMLDLLDVKRIQDGGLDPQAATARYTLTVAEAAERFGMSTSAVRQAVQAKKLAADRHVAVGPCERRHVPGHPRASVMIGCASATREAQACAPSCPVLSTPSSGRAATYVMVGELHAFRRIAVMTTSADSAPMFVLERDPGNENLVFGQFWVRGAFRVVERINNPRRSAEAWRGFEAE